MKIHEVAGNIMHKMDAFKGSRQAMDTPQMLIVRGMSRKEMEAEDLKKIINDIRHTELSKIGSELQKQAKKEYTWEKISAKYLSLIN